jgi:hypothetical protein
MTAVEFLIEQIFSEEDKSFLEFYNGEIQRALEMEKQQIENAFQYKFFHPYAENEPEQYYNETYKPST